MSDETEPGGMTQHIIQLILAGGIIFLVLFRSMKVQTGVTWGNNHTRVSLSLFHSSVYGLPSVFRYRATRLTASAWKLKAQPLGYTTWQLGW